MRCAVFPDTGLRQRLRADRDRVVDRGARPRRSPDGLRFRRSRGPRSTRLRRAAAARHRDRDPHRGWGAGGRRVESGLVFVRGEQISGEYGEPERPRRRGLVRHPRPRPPRRGRLPVHRGPRPTTPSSGAARTSPPPRSRTSCSTHPGITEAAVIGVLRSRMGTAPRRRPRRHRVTRTRSASGSGIGSARPRPRTRSCSATNFPRPRPENYCAATYWPNWRTPMPEAVIVSALRTPIGTAIKGTLRDTTAFDLAHHVVVGRRGGPRHEPDRRRDPRRGPVRRRRDRPSRRDHRRARLRTRACPQPALRGGPGRGADRRSGASVPAWTSS